MRKNTGINSIIKTPLCIVDIGASGGISPRWAKLTSNYKTILFEPHLEAFKKLNSAVSDNQVVLNSGLSDRSGNVDFYLCKKQMVSSMFIPDFPFINKFFDPERYNIVKTCKILTDTLDSQLLKNNIGNVDFIKVDTQGSELLILKGGENTLKNVIGLEVEVEFVPIYENQPLFTDVDEFVKRFGFTLFDLKRYFWTRKDAKQNFIGKGQIVFADALYFRTPENICSLPDISEEKIIHSFYVYLAYGYTDLALTLCNLAYTGNILSKNMYDKLILLVGKYAKKDFIPNFKGRGTIYNLMAIILDILSPRSWFEGTDLKIGNQ